MSTSAVRRQVHRKRFMVVLAVAVALAAATAVTLLVRESPEGQPAASPPPTHGASHAGGAPTSPYPFSDVYISADRYMLYGSMEESRSTPGAPCWISASGSARFLPDGTASISLRAHTVSPPHHAACAGPAIKGPWYVAVPLDRAYHHPSIIDVDTGLHRRILGVINPSRSELVNLPMGPSACTDPRPVLNTAAGQVTVDPDNGVPRVLELEVGDVVTLDARLNCQQVRLDFYGRAAILEPRGAREFLALRAGTTQLSLAVPMCPSASIAAGCRGGMAVLAVLAVHVAR